MSLLTSNFFKGLLLIIAGIPLFYLQEILKSPKLAIELGKKGNLAEFIGFVFIAYGCYLLIQHFKQLHRGDGDKNHINGHQRTDKEQD